MLHVDPSSPLDLVLHSTPFWLSVGSVYLGAFVRYVRSGDHR